MVTKNCHGLLSIILHVLVSTAKMHDKDATTVTNGPSSALSIGLGVIFSLIGLAAILFLIVMLRNRLDLCRHINYRYFIACTCYCVLTGHTVVVCRDVMRSLIFVVPMPSLTTRANYPRERPGIK